MIYAPIACAILVVVALAAFRVGAEIGFRRGASFARRAYLANFDRAARSEMYANFAKGIRFAARRGSPALMAIFETCAKGAERMARQVRAEPLDFGVADRLDTERKEAP